jgi:uncharacterized OB-fold protein
MPERFVLKDDGTAALVGSRCEDCGAYFHGPVQFCQRCTSENVVAVELSRRGELHSYTYVIRAPAGWTGPEPYALAEVMLPENVLVASRVVDWKEGEDLAIGAELEVVAEPVETDEEGNEIVVYAWRRVRS